MFNQTTVRGVTGAGTSSNPYQIGIPESHTNSVTSYISIVYYEVQLTVGESYRFEITNVDYSFRLTTNSGFQEGTTSGQSGSPKYIIYTAYSYSGTYKIEALSGGSTASYTLTTAKVPNLVSPSNGAYKSDPTPLLDWDTVSGATQYHIQIDTQNTFPSPFVYITTSNTQYTPTALSTGTYFWRVRAEVNTIFSLWSETRSFIIFTGPGTPSLVSPSNGDLLSDHTPTLYWTSVTGAVKYRIQVDESNTFPSPVKDTVITTTSLAIVSTLADIKYYWRVSAGDVDNKYGSWSSTLSFSIYTPLSAPTLVTPASGTFTTDITPLLSWNSVTQASDYRIQIDDQVSYSSPIVNAITTSPFFTSTALADNTKYYWRVHARDSNGYEGIWSLNRNFTVDTTILSAPILTSPSNANSLNDKSPDFTWSSVFGAVSYVIEIDNDNAFTSVVDTDNPTSTSYTSPILNTGIYYWHVAAKESNGNLGTWSSVWSFTILSTIGESISNPISILSIPINVTGTVPGPGINSEMWYSVTLMATTSYRFTLNDTGLKMELYNSLNNLVKETSSISYYQKLFDYMSETGGTFYIKVIQLLSGTSLLPYRLEINYSSGSTFETAFPTTIPSTLFLTFPGLSNMSGVWYSIDLNGDSRYDLSTYSYIYPSYKSIIINNLVISIFDSSGNLQFNLISLVNSSSINVIKTDTYYMHIYLTDSSVTTSFYLEVKEIEPFGSSATSMSVPGIKTGTLSYPSDGIWYSVILLKGEEYQFTLSASYAGLLNFDAALYLYDSNGILLKVAKVFFPAELKYIPTVDATFYINIVPEKGTGTFTLKIEILSQVSQSTTDTTTDHASSTILDKTGTEETDLLGSASLLVYWWIFSAIIIVSVLRKNFNRSR